MKELKESIRYITQEERELYEKIAREKNIKGYSFSPFVLYDKTEPELKLIKKKKAKTRKPIRKNKKI